MNKEEIQKYLGQKFQKDGFYSIPMSVIASELYLKLIYGAIKEVTKRNVKHNYYELNQMLKIILNGALTKKGKRFLNYKLVNVN